jgi:Glutathione S-transferase, C-terminal domain
MTIDHHFPLFGPIVQTIAVMSIFGAGCLLAEVISIVVLNLVLMLNRLILHGSCVPTKLIADVQYQWQRPSIQLWVQHDRWEEAIIIGAIASA